MESFQRFLSSNVDLLFYLKYVKYYDFVNSSS